MNQVELKQLLNNHLSVDITDPGLYHIDFSNEWGASISKLATDYFFGRRLSFRLIAGQSFVQLQDSINNASSDINFSVVGEDVPFKTLTLNIIFALNNSGLARLKISSTQLATGGHLIPKLSLSFPLFENTLADKLILGSIFIDLDSDRIATDENSSLEITAKLNLKQTINNFNTLLNLPEIIDLTGPAWLENGGADFYGISLFAVEGELGQTLAFDNPRFSITLKKLGVADESTYNFIDDTYYSYPYIILNAIISINGVDIPIGVEMADPDKDIHFKANFDKLIKFGLTEFETFLGLNTGIFSASSPGSIAIANQITFDEFGIYYNPKDKIITRLYGGIKFDSKSDQPSEFPLPIRITGLHFDVTQSATGKNLQIIIDGEIEVTKTGFIELRVIKSSNGYSFAGWLRENDQIKLSEIIQKFKGSNDNVRIPDFSVGEIDFIFKSENSKVAWSFDIGLKGSLPIPFDNPVLTIEQFRFSILKAENVFQYFIEGVFLIGSVEITLFAGHDPKGWIFKGSTGPGQEIPFGELIGMLWDKLVPDNGDHKIPAAIAALVAKNIDITIDTTDPAGFSFIAECDISESKTFNESFEVAGRDSNSPPLIATGDPLITLQNINIKLERTQSIKFSATADFKIKNTFPFHVVADYNDGWSFEASFNKEKADIIGLSISSLASAFEFTTPALPDFLNNFTIDEASVAFKAPPPTAKGAQSAARSEKHFTLSGHDHTANTSIKFDLQLDITYPNDIETIFFSGHMTVNDAYVFDIVQQKNGVGKVFLASYHKENDKDKFDIKILLQKLGVTDPPSMSLSLKDAFFVYDKSNTASFNLFVADIDAAMNLSNLPLVGKALPADASISLALRVLYASDKYKWGVADINSILPNGITKIAEPVNDASNKALDLIAEIRIGEQRYYLGLPIILNGQNEVTTAPSAQPANTAITAAPAIPTNTPVPVKDGITWFNIGKNFGPVIFNRIGLSYKDSLLNVYLDAGLSEGGLTFTLNGLSVSTPVTKFEPTFHLNGLGLDLKKGPLEIGASFIRRQIQVTENGKTETVDEYDGLAMIGLETFSISALGSYAYYKGHPSLFIFAYLNAALGGPAFFFVEGLAAAFGYNRALIMPSIDSVSKFPLVRQVMEGSDPTLAAVDRATFLTQQLEAISTYIPPSPGDMFLAVGIKFSTFKLIDSFVLLAVSFGNHLEIDVIGQSNIIVPSEVPPGIPPLAEIKIQLLAKFLPEEGFLGVMAQLTPDSYIFSKDCHLTGGAAFYCWFKGEHQGDFVMTMGGYHSSFNVPSHYPVAPRLGLNWQVTNSLSVKGDMYFALCPHAFMAGGHLEALYNDDPLRAWFKAGADFLISWQPYHYDARLYIDIGASYTYHFFGTHHITVDLGADLHIWGPDFSGTATIHIWIIDVNVSFGSGASAAAQPIGWDDFVNKCLPAKEKIVSVAITKGKHNEDANKTAIVNPKDLTISVNSAVPVTSLVTSTPKATNSSFGVSPMSVSNITSSTQTVTIKKVIDGVPKVLTDLSDLNIDFVKQKVPSAIWGQQFSPNINLKDRIIELVTGLTVTTKEPDEFPKAGPGLVDGVDYNIKITQGYIPSDINIAGIFQSPKAINETIKPVSSDFDNLLKELELIKIKTVSF